MRFKIVNLFSVSKLVTYLILSLCAVTTVVQAQLKPGEVATSYTNNIFTKEFHVGALAHTAGFGANFTYAKYKTAKKLTEYHISFMNVKHPQEKKVLSQYVLVDNAKSYAYGKLNSVLLMKPSYGLRKIISKKERRNGVQLSYVYGAGPTIGFVKPVYLVVTYPSDPRGVFAEERYDPDKHDVFNIVGRSSGLLGINETKLAIGGHARVGLNFEYSPGSETYRALEVGAMLDVFPQAIEIMANENNSNYYLNIYLSLLFGKKTPR